MSLSRTLQYAFLAIVTISVGFSLYQWNASRASTQKTAPNNGLVGYWSFNEGTGTQAGDASVNKNTGTLTNGPTWVSGRLGQAVNFDGVDDHVITNLTTHYSQTTFSAWIYPRTLGEGNLGRIFDKRENGGTETFFLSMSTGTNKLLLQRVFSVTNGLWNSPNSSIVLNAWNHIVITYDETSTANDPVIYINGVSVTVSRVGGPSGTVLTNTDKYIIGNRGDTTRSFDGLIDEVRIYNRALSGTEVTNLYNLGAEKLNVSPVSNLTSGLVGYWTFDGKDTPWSSSSAGTATDRSGNSNTGTLTNMSQSTSVTRGKLGQALNFDGTDDYVDAPDSALYTQSALSVSFWTKIPTMNISLNPLVVKTGSGVRSWMTNASATGNIVFTTALNNNEVSTYGTSVGAISGNKWEHVVCVFNGSGVANADRMQIYIDGVPQSITFTGTIPATLVDTSAHLFIGNNGSQYLPGTLDDVRIYNRQISPTEVQSLYDLGASDKVNSSVSQNQGTGRLDSGLVGYWKLDDASGTTATDSSTNANNGTLTNGPTWGTGRIGGDVVFDGTNGYIDLGNRSVLNLTNNFSISLWLNINSITQGYWKRFFGGDDINGTTRPVYMEYDYTANQYRAVWQNGGTFGSIAGKTLTAVQWQHFVVTFKDGVAKSYSDGVLVGSSSGVVQPPSNAVNSYIGGTPGIGVFPGSIDEVRVYNRVLSADEVWKLYRLTTPTGVDTSLKGYWSFDGKATNWTSSSAGTVSDLSGSANTGTMTNMSQSTSVIRGKLGQALSFDGTDDYTTTPDSATLDAGDTADLTLIGWFYRNTATTDDTIIAKRNGIANTDDGYILYIDDSTDKLTFEVSENSGTDEYSLESTTTFTTPGWYHYAVVWDQDSAGNSEIYLSGVTNGATDTGTIGNIGDLSNALTLNIGSESDGGNPFDGKLDEVRIYNRALSESEIWAMYQSGGGTVNTCKSSSVADADGNTYGTIQIGSQCWMKQNMRVGTRIAASSNQTDNAVTEKYCYSDSDVNCTSNNPNQPDGGLYQWDEMMQYSTTPGARGICPAGWHIPTDGEQYTLENYLKDNGQTCNASRSGLYDCDTAGTKLKPNGSSGFEGNLAGVANAGSFNARGANGSFWSSSESGATAFYRTLSSASSKVGRTASTRSLGFSVRCLQDSP